MKSWSSLMRDASSVYRHLQRYNRTMRREWVTTRRWVGSKDPGQPAVRVMTYNILAEYLAFRHEWDLYNGQSWFLQWQRRRRLLVDEVLYYRPDILCLQEVDHFSYFKRKLAKFGYDGHFQQRPNEKHDGCATFWRTSKFEKVDAMGIDFRHFNLKENVALIVGLAPRQSTSMKGPILWVGNIHVYFNPKHGDVKLGQLRIFLHALHGKMAKSKMGGLAFVVGDFNCLPGSATYDFVRHGALQLLDHDRSTLSGQLLSRRCTKGLNDNGKVNDSISDGQSFDNDHNNGTGNEEGDSSNDDQPESLTPPSTLLEDSITQKGWDFQTLFNAMQPTATPCSKPLLPAHTQNESSNDPLSINDCVIAHPLKLKSAYFDTLNKEIEFTTAHRGALETVDYIFYTNEGHSGDLEEAEWKLRPERVLMGPHLNSSGYKFRSWGGFAGKGWPSDHIPLIADFTCTQLRSN